jgi:hypothetical protein
MPPMAMLGHSLLRVQSHIGPCAEVSCLTSNMGVVAVVFAAIAAQSLASVLLQNCGKLLLQ